VTPFPGARRRDEIGDLARALEDLTGRLSAHIALLEGFAADVAHEFKNPLAAIRSAAETIDACDNPEERSRFVTFMIRDVGRLERLVSGLRDLARIDRQLEQREAAVVDVAALVHAIAGRVQALNAGGVRVDVESAGTACRIAGDGESLGQVFENLLTNAASFAPDGTAVVVRISRDADNCCVSVSDRGPGIPESHLARVFERFFSYRPSDAPREHLGLGLAIAKRIVEGHGGTIAAANRADGGATFEVRLPSG
jgi:two-component system sensor histidine kinase ChvG